MEEKIIEYKEEWIKESPFMPTIIPGLNDVKINGKISIDGDSGNKVKMLQFTRSASVGTGLQTFSGFGFSPTSYHIRAWRDAYSNPACYSELGRDILGIEGGYNSESGNSGTHYGSIKVNYANQGGGQTIAYFNSFSSDGIVLDFIQSEENIKLIITAYY